ncbi:DNA-directed RNA polymerase II subunit RPB1-like [Penaeus japonicus]|uniref:DNA-directed RNA polymerase II subunit RPB1-like n=1 Tax=Penaeus japonicus TaxID=27405 RepID=UPI001C70B2EE|nr:DNA-directed RNA polymerase II subunit RPB1-like [Penaeus japonicus]
MRLYTVLVLVLASNAFAKPTAQNVVNEDDGRLSVAIYDTGNPYYGPFNPVYDPYAPVYDPYNPYYDPYNPYYDPYNPYYDPYNPYSNPNSQRPYNSYRPYYDNNYYTASAFGNFIGGAVGGFLNGKDSAETSQQDTTAVAF